MIPVPRPPWFFSYKTADVASFWENNTIELKPVASHEESPLKNPCLRFWKNWEKRLYKIKPHGLIFKNTGSGIQDTFFVRTT